MTSLSLESEVCRLDATGQAQLVANGEVSPRELVDVAIARIERINPVINAVITRTFDEAIRTVEADLPDGPFRGVPMLIKDLRCEVAGSRYTMGTRVLRDMGWRSHQDSYLTTKYKEAGFVLLGKSNLAELGVGVTTEPVAFGATKNPWNLSRTAGGSSGGSAAAVAAGLVPVAHGGDNTGSLRLPASCCGLVGLKPSRGRVSLGPKGVPLLGHITQVEHVLTRSVRDTAAVLDATQGRMPGDLFVAPPPERFYADEVEADPGSLRVGLLTHDAMMGLPVSRDCSQAVEAAGRLLEQLGHAVELDYPQALDGLLRPLAMHYAVDAAISARRAVEHLEQLVGRQLRDGDVDPRLLHQARTARRYSALELAGAIDTMASSFQELECWWHTGHDLLVSPTMNEPPWRLGESERAHAGYFTVPWSFTGQPAISLPLQWTADGMPIGVQLVADYGREDLLVRVAAQLERARPWSKRRPRDVALAGEVAP